MHEDYGRSMLRSGRNGDHFQRACHSSFRSLSVFCTRGVTSRDYKDGKKNECSGGDGSS
jgi:hypothetical protein